MAAIDSLLRLLTAQKAETLVLSPGKAPKLVKAGVSKPLSMPALAPEMFDTFVMDLLTPEERGSLGSTGALHLEYQAQGVGKFNVHIEGQGATMVAKFKPAGLAPKPIALDGPPPEAPRVEPRPAPVMPAPEPWSPPVVSGPTSVLESLLRRAVENEASDIILSTGGRPSTRVGGRLVRLPGPLVTEESLMELLGPELTADRRRGLVERGSVDLALELAEPDGLALRFRVNVFRQLGGLAAAIRPVRTRVPSLNELGLPGAIRSLVEHPHGLVLLTGPTGSGKSTTLAALIEHLNQTVSRHIITLEDPIEYRYIQGHCLIHQRELGEHVRAFADGLWAALRESPDVILLGEMRDQETIAAALTAAETGHLVLSTLHCGSAAMSIDRILDAFPEAKQAQVRMQLADVLRSVVSQRLVAAVQSQDRLPVLEILHVTYGIANLIREGKTHQIQSHIQTGREHGMVSLDRSLADLVRSGRISATAAMEAAADPKQLAEELGTR